ncbi:MAG: hypothetical protein HRU75_14120 [Planctomycetia bacterium]|nr:MAG: hypothetical protein HRU75_14120 [Planctomycetia bacterium]
MSEIPAQRRIAAESAGAGRAGEPAGATGHEDGAVPHGRAEAAPPPTGDAQPVAPRIASRYVDVWTRTEPRYRRRAVLMLAANTLLYCGLCVFTHWLHVGRLFDFSLRSYAEPARFWGEQTRTLHDFILFPISVEQTPIHGVVLALLLASMVAVPIVTSILYRIPCALPLAAAVAVFAHMPWMAATLVLSCTLAGWRPIRMNFRFGSALLGMLPVILYIYLALRGGPEMVGASASPVQKTLLLAPWYLAILSACVMMGVILLIAHMVRYRPGAITPVVTVMFATPVVLFHGYVGTDELSYRVLEAECGPRSRRVAALQDPAAVQERIIGLLQEWSASGRQSVREDLLATLAGDSDRLRERVRSRLLLEFLVSQRETDDLCRDFLARHPRSRYVTNVLYIQGYSLDTRMDARALAGGPPRVELYAEFPHAQSRPVWLALWNQSPDSPLRIVAGVRLAVHDLRAGEAGSAQERLERVLEIGAGGAAASQPAARGLLATPPAEESLEFEARPFLSEAEQLLALVRANRDCPAYGNAPLAELFALDPHRPRYSAALERLALRRPGALLHDNLRVAWAASLPSSAERAAALRAICDEGGAGDALAEAHYRLAEIEIQHLGVRDEALRTAGIERLRRVAADYDPTWWGRAARERLALLKPAPSNGVEGSSTP